LTKILLHLDDKYSTPGLFIILQIATELTKILLHLDDKYSTPGFIQYRFKAMVALAVYVPVPVCNLKYFFNEVLYIIQHVLSIGFNTWRVETQLQFALKLL
jgi:hypothetical protein